MSPTNFTATLLRASASGFAGLAASRTAERSGADGELEGGFGAWQAHFKSLVEELAAAADDGGIAAFAAKVKWTQEAFASRGLATDILSVGLEELEAVLEESLPATAWKPLPEFFQAARTELLRDGESHEQGDSDIVGGSVTTYLAKLLEGDAQAAIASVTGAVDAGSLSVPQALEGILTTALREIGRRWHADEVNVAQEHFATQVSGRLLERLILMAPASQPNGRTVMLTMIEGDAHDLGLRIVAALFELDGWRTICLGANMPSIDLPQAIETFEVDLVLLGATLNTQRDTVGRAIEMLRAARPGIKIIAGGSAFVGCEHRAVEIGADGCALMARHAVELGRELLES
ncbi:MAG: methanogenic corrinoid protein MtbC1 [Planctomycetota bacterium]|jgi:methanogenic corrinoid protein MtbC1